MTASRLSLILACCLALAVAPGPAAAKARHGRRHGHAKPSAAALARSVTRAHSTAARRRALKAVMRRVGVGVYTGHGRPLVKGFERGPQSVYLYDFEIDALAHQLGRRSRESFDQLAAEMNAGGLTLRGKAPTGASLAAAAKRGISKLHGRRARTPEGTLGLVVRDLGRARHVDLAHRQPHDKAVLDPLQALLLVIDAARASGRSSHSGHHARTAAYGALRSPTVRAASCEGGNFFGSAGNGAIGLSILTGKGIGPRSIITKEIVDGLHGVALAYSFAFTEVQSHVTGAFGTSGYHSAPPMRFQVRASLRDGLGGARAPCGALAGERPSVQGIPVTWDPERDGHLSYLGKVICGSDCTETGPDGVATLTLQPDDEYLPGAGRLIFKHGTVVAESHPQQAAGNILGSVAEALGFTKDGAFGWDVSFRDPPGYRVEIPQYSTTFSTFGHAGSATNTFTDMEVCSRSSDLPHPTVPNVAIGRASDPPSSLPPTWTSVQTIDGHTVTIPDGNADIPMAGAAQFPASFSVPPAQIYPDGSAISGMWDFSGPALRASITVQPAGTPGITMTSPSQTFELPVTEARGCQPVGVGP